MSIGRIGALGSYSGTGGGTSYGVPSATLAMAYQPPYGKLTRQVPSPWKPISRIGSRTYGSAPMEWVTPLSTPLDARQNMDLIRAAATLRPVQGVRRRQPTVAAFGDLGALRDPMKDSVTGAQGAVFSPGWFADLFTISPGEKQARLAKKAVAKSYAQDRKLARIKKGTPSTGANLLTGLADTASTIMKATPGSGGNAMVSQPTGSDVVVQPEDLGTESALPAFVKPLVLVAMLGVAAAVGYKMLKKSKKSKSGSAA